MKPPDKMSLAEFLESTGEILPDHVSDLERRLRIAECELWLRHLPPNVALDWLQRRFTEWLHSDRRSK